MIPDFKTYIKESIWSDMQDRGTGDMVKKEDDVNLMDPYQFAEYLSGRYKIKSKIRSSGIDYLKSSNELTVPILSKGTGWNTLLTMEYGRKNGIYLGIDIIKDFPEFYQQMNDNFILNKERHKRITSFTSWYIYPKDGSKINNSFFVTVLDFIISTGEKYLIVSKNLRESIWSDMQDRGTGNTIKKEDEFDFIGGFKLYERLRKMYKYTNVKGHIIAYYNYQGRITVPLFVDEGMNLFNIDYFVNSGKLSIYARWYDDARNIFIKLSKKYHIYHPNVSIYHIEPFDGDVTNTFFIEVVDFILSCVEPPYKKVIERNDPVSESVWSDMQDRGTGDVIKKEDDVDLITDLKGLYEYIKKRYNPPEHIISLVRNGHALEFKIGVDYFTNIGATDLKITIYWIGGAKTLVLGCTKPILDEISKKYGTKGIILKQENEELKNSIIIGVIDTFLDVIKKYKQMDTFIK